MRLLAKIRSILNREEPVFQWQDGSPLPRDIQIALAALLLEVANGDGECLKSEYRQIFIECCTCMLNPRAPETG